MFNCILEPERASYVISGTFVWPIVRYRPVKFRDPGLNSSREIPLEAVEGVLCGRFSIVDNFRLEVANDVISSYPVLL